MSLFVLHIIALLVLAVFTVRAYGDNVTESDLSHLLSENDGGIKRVDLAESTRDRTLPRPTTPEIIFKPTPASKPTSTQVPIEISKPIAVIGGSPQKPVVLPPLATIISENRVPVCGRKGRCYQWFDDEIEAVSNGYKRCSPANERLARWYCCVP